MKKSCQKLNLCRKFRKKSKSFKTSFIRIAEKMNSQVRAREAKA